MEALNIVPEETNVTEETTEESVTTNMEKKVEEETTTEEKVETKTAPKPGTPEYTKAVQKRIDELTREKYEQKRKADALERKLAELETAVYIPPRPTRPDIETFKNDLGELDNKTYNEALTKYEDNLFDWKEKTVTAERQKKTSQESRQTNIANFYQKADELREKYKDFDDAINAPNFTPDVQDAIFDSEYGAEIAYFLGKNKGEATRIGTLPLAQMLIEFGKLENRFSADTTKKRVSNAPKPIKPVSGGTEEVTVKKPEEMTAKEYLDAKRAGKIKT